MNVEVLRRAGPAVLPLRVGAELVTFELHYFELSRGRWIAAWTGDLAVEQPLLLRIESACIFGHVFGSAQCDCGYQLREAFRRIGSQGRGLVLYGLDEDARGLGVAEHFDIYRMRQQEGLDTSEVYARLDAPVDARSCEPVVDILRILGVGRIRLMTNNPRRWHALRDAGFEVERDEIEAPLDVHNMSTLMIEQEDLGYLWSFATHGDHLTPMRAEVVGLPDHRRLRLVVDTREVVAELVDDGCWSFPDLDPAHIIDPGLPVVAYLTDFPRLDELGGFKAAGAEVLVLPYRDLPPLLVAAARAHGLRLVDWAREPGPAAPRPQWWPVAVDATGVVYRRGECVRLVAPDGTWLERPVEPGLDDGAAVEAVLRAAGVTP